MGASLLQIKLLWFPYVHCLDCWNPNLRTNDQMRALVRNFSWGGRAEKTQAKVKWDVITLLVCKGGLGVINSKAQVEALLAK